MIEVDSESRLRLDPLGRQKRFRNLLDLELFRLLERDPKPELGWVDEGQQGIVRPDLSGSSHYLSFLNSGRGHLQPLGSSASWPIIHLLQVFGHTALLVCSPLPVP